MSQTIRTRLNCAGSFETLIGGRSENQDSAGSADTALGDLIIVCDGMGGLKGGKHASSLAVKTVIEYVSSVSGDSDPVETMKTAVAKANSIVSEEGMKDEYKGMGTTLVALLITPFSAVVAQVGDSRVYQLRKGKKIFRTSDHSMVFDMVRANVITEEQARLSDCSNIILKAVGIDKTVAPDIYELPYRKGDRFVLCTDGFWGAVDEPTLLKMLTERGSLDDRTRTMAHEIDDIGMENGGGHDNLTVAVIDVFMDSGMRDKNFSRQTIVSMVPYLLLVISIGFNIYFVAGSLKLRQDMTGNCSGQLYSGIKTDLESLREDINAIGDLSPADCLTVAKIEGIIDRLDVRENKTESSDTNEK